MNFLLNFLDGSVAPIVDIGWAAPAGQMYSNAEGTNFEIV